jgi:hypothetical protein
MNMAPEVLRAVNVQITAFWDVTSREVSTDEYKQ